MYLYVNINCCFHITILNLKFTKLPAHAASSVISRIQCATGLTRIFRSTSSCASVGCKSSHPSKFNPGSHRGMASASVSATLGVASPASLRSETLGEGPGKTGLPVTSANAMTFRGVSDAAASKASELLDRRNPEAEAVAD